MCPCHLKADRLTVMTVRCIRSCLCDLRAGAHQCSPSCSHAYSGVVGWSSCCPCFQGRGRPALVLRARCSAAVTLTVNKGNVIQATQIHKGNKLLLPQCGADTLAALRRWFGSRSVSDCCLIAVLAHFHFAEQECCCIGALPAHLLLPCAAASSLQPHCGGSASPPCGDGGYAE